MSLPAPYCYSHVVVSYDLTVYAERQISECQQVLYAIYGEEQTEASMTPQGSMNSADTEAESGNGSTQCPQPAVQRLQVTTAEEGVRTGRTASPSTSQDVVAPVRGSNDY